MATKNELDAVDGAPATPAPRVDTPGTRPGLLIAVIGGGALASALLVGGGVVLGFSLGHADHDRPSFSQEFVPGGDRFEGGPLGEGPREEGPRGDLREFGPRLDGPPQNQQQEESETDSE